MIFTNKCIRQEISNAVNPIAIPYIERFIRDMEELKAVTKLKLYVTGTEEEARDRRLRQAYKSTLMLTAAIKGTRAGGYIGISFHLPFHDITTEIPNLLV